MICSSASAVLLLTGYWPVMGASVAVFTKEGEVQVVLPEDEVELAAANFGRVFDSLSAVNIGRV